MSQDAASACVFATRRPSSSRSQQFPVKGESHAVFPKATATLKGEGPLLIEFWKGLEAFKNASRVSCQHARTLYCTRHQCKLGV